MPTSIPLTSGLVAIVDDEDAAWAGQWSWHAAITRRGRDPIYARRHDGAGFLKMHRALLGVGAGQIIDHINGNGLDNRRCNLRICSPVENARNRRVNRASTSGFKGVTKVPCASPWRAQIKLRSRTKYLGWFKTAEEAARAYDAAAREHFGDFAWLNFSGEERAT